MTTTVFDGRLIGAFYGYRRGNLYVLDSGTAWEQVDDTAEFACREFPRCKLLFDASEGSYFLYVTGMSSVAEVRRYECGR